MKKSILKKALAMLLSATMMTSVMSVCSISASATEIEDTKNYYIPSEDTETTRLYFYMPQEWYNEYTDTAGVYWWEGTDACSEWADMYAMRPTETENIYSLDVPKDVIRVIFNNNINGGWDMYDPIYWYAEHSGDVWVGSMIEEGELWSYAPEIEAAGIPADSELYREGIHSFDGMIYVLDYNSDTYPAVSKRIYTGEWYYYYGNGEYGFTPEKGEFVYTSDYNDIEVSIAQKYGYDVPVNPSTRPTRNTIPTYATPPTTQDGTSNCVIEPTEPETTIGIPVTENPWVEDSSAEVDETTQDITSNCVIEPTDMPTVDIVTEPTENTTTAVINTEPTEASKETYPTYPKPTDMGDHTNPPTRQTEPSDLTTKIYFDVESSGWKNYSKIYCHIWRADGTGEWPAWQSKKELCTKEAEGLYSFDTLNTGNEIKYTDGRIYGVIFSADTGAQTYNMVMSGACLGDTAYAIETSYEAPEDSEKKAVFAEWRNTRNCGSQKSITSTGFIIGNAFFEGENNNTLVADYLIKYYDDQAKKDRVPNIMRLNGVSPESVRLAVLNKLDAFIAKGEMQVADAAVILNEINEVLNTQDPVDDIVPKDAKIYFDVESTGWKNYNNIYCHIWKADGRGNWPAWHSKKELCTKEADGRYSYTLSKTGKEFRYSDKNLYCVIFSADTGAQTYEVVMNGECIGDTVYDTGIYFEGPSDDDKKAIEARWRYNKLGGPKKKITSTGNVVGTAHIEGETDETLMADYLLGYWWKEDIEYKTQKLFTELSLDKTALLNEIKVLIEYEVSTKHQPQEYFDTAYAEIEKILEYVIEENNLMYDINGDEYIDVNDVTTLQMYLANYAVKVNETKIDVDRDGIVDVRDVTALQLYLASPNKNPDTEHLA